MTLMEIIDLHRIEKVLLSLDNTAYDTIEEADNSLIQYGILKDEIVSIIKQVIENFSISFTIKENIYKEAIRILANHIGSAKDMRKYGSILESFHNEGKLTEQQLNSFYDNFEFAKKSKF